jgi:dienelactone hydrolase
MKFKGLLLAVLALLVSVPVVGQDDPMSGYWDAATPAEAADAATAIVDAGTGFDAVHAALASGRTYSKNAPTGQMTLTNETPDGASHNFTISVPESYDPTRKYGLILYLHGGVSTPQTNLGERSVRQVAEGFGKEDYITVAPSGHGGAVWWREVQINNVNGIIDRLKRTYNIDENRVFMSGFSDGASGTYFFAFKNSTPFAGLLPWHGHMAVIANPRAQADGQVYIPNLRNKPLWVCNGEKDQLYPTQSVQPFIDVLKEADVPVDWNPNKAGHDFGWMPEFSEEIATFFAETRRNPHPDALYWETELTERYNRVHWLIINELGTVEGETDFEDINVHYAQPQRKLLGVQLDADNGGAVIAGVTEDSVAAKAGLKEGDIIVEANGANVASRQDLVGAIQATDFGEDLKMKVKRGDEEIELTGTFPAKQEPGKAPATFKRDKASGRVELTREGNTVNVKTEGVKKFTLLISPDQFDFSQPIKVVTNGKVSFEKSVSPSVKTLLKWAVTDNDRTMLYGAELTIEVADEVHTEENGR